MTLEVFISIALACFGLTVSYRAWRSLRQYDK